MEAGYYTTRASALSAIGWVVLLNKDRGEVRKQFFESVITSRTIAYGALSLLQAANLILSFAATRSTPGFSPIGSCLSSRTNCAVCKASLPSWKSTLYRRFFQKLP